MCHLGIGDCLTMMIETATFHIQNSREIVYLIERMNAVSVWEEWNIHCGDVHQAAALQPLFLCLGNITALAEPVHGQLLVCYSMIAQVQFLQLLPSLVCLCVQCKCLWEKIMKEIGWKTWL